MDHADGEWFGLEVCTLLLQGFPGDCNFHSMGNYAEFCRVCKKKADDRARSAVAQASSQQGSAGASNAGGFPIRF